MITKGLKLGGPTPGKKPPARGGGTPTPPGPAAPGGQSFPGARRLPRARRKRKGSRGGEARQGAGPGAAGEHRERRRSPPGETRLPPSPPEVTAAPPRPAVSMRGMGGGKKLPRMRAARLALPPLPASRPAPSFSFSWRGRCRYRGSPGASCYGMERRREKRPPRGSDSPFLHTHTHTHAAPPPLPPLRARAEHVGGAEPGERAHPTPPPTRARGARQRGRMRSGRAGRPASVWRGAGACAVAAARLPALSRLSPPSPPAPRPAGLCEGKVMAV